MRTDMNEHETCFVALLLLVDDFYGILLLQPEPAAEIGESLKTKFGGGLSLEKNKLQTSLLLIHNRPHSSFPAAFCQLRQV